MGGIPFNDDSQNPERLRLIAFLLTIKAGDGQIDLHIEPVRMGLGQTRENLTGLGEVELPHQAHPAIVLGNQLRIFGNEEREIHATAVGLFITVSGIWNPGFARATGDAQDGDHNRQGNDDDDPGDLPVHSSPPVRCLALRIRSRIPSAVSGCSSALAPGKYDLPR